MSFSRSNIAKELKQNLLKLRHMVNAVKRKQEAIAKRVHTAAGNSVANTDATLERGKRSRRAQEGLIKLSSELKRHRMAGRFTCEGGPSC